MITAQVIKELNSPDLNFVSGSMEAIASKVLPPELCDSESLVFVSKPEQLAAALTAQAPIIVAHKALTLPADSKSTLFLANSAQLAMAAILPLFDGKMNRFNQTEKIHPTAVIHPTAHLGKNVCLGPYAVIGEQAKIGEGTTIGAHTVVESFAEVGDHSLLHPHVFLGSHCVLGARCEIHPHTTIGSDGFAFVMNKEGHQKKIPQIGRVVIGNDVELGANCAIDRAALTETRIGNGTKMDNFCHIAHNVIIGENCVMAAKFSVAGSSKIGNNCMFGGEVAVSDHVTITDRVVIAGRGAVTFNLTESGQYGGYPLEPLRDALKTLTNKTHITRIRKDLARVIKHLGLKEE
ncbi:UDP-3-O-(3-hydroxymyristoyl)glucosamine N-acyltransferase [Bdellovibrio bacteriovorus]|uniref:UDP-3-O-(3-hydroxymyristoyl)glucosamine N-acyltransferase n=1 Tax=Bdellovibrio bacteriovorus TaxID=959 RepID=UPI0021D0ED43|nr:UDP-3-O-(3-hydroxymyristoyl)glucosamine N-acyltransferase [Bdellovibrio bacteriovorus]UXR65276.1 UDP-3-O-(3-hydroxymyristoyl)glucosamine N-acyltransferase [Bdellovibrio bacteriovorus]